MHQKVALGTYATSHPNEESLKRSKFSPCKRAVQFRRLIHSRFSEMKFKPGFPADFSGRPIPAGWLEGVCLWYRGSGLQCFVESGVEPIREGTHPGVGGGAFTNSGASIVMGSWMAKFRMEKSQSKVDGYDDSFLLAL